MVEEPSRVLLWSERALPAEVRGLLLGTIALFGVAAIALALVTRHGAVTLAVTVAACLASVMLSLWLAWTYDTPRSTGMLTVVLLAAVVLMVTALVASAQATTVLATGLPFAFTMAWHRPAWLGLLTGSGAIGVSTAFLTAQPGSSFPVQEAFIMTLLLGAATIGFAAAHVGWHLQRRLDQHDADQRDLALTRERLRFATDLHDIQGHTMLAIKLKAELARRNIDHDPGTAREELGEIEGLAAEAERGTRDLAHGYRSLNLTAELANVERLLGAAGIDVAVHRTGPPPPDLDQPFAALAREAASNILRHTGAATVRIHLSETTMVIENDGADSDTELEPRGGTGLADLQRRFAEHGGTFSWQRDGDRFSLTGQIGVRP